LKYRNRPRRLGVEQGSNFRVVGKPPGGKFGIDGLAVGDDLKRSTGSRDKLDLCAVAFYQQVPRTEGTRLVVSNDAVFDADFRRGGHISKAPIARLY
jgi:hypothetical protein